MGMDIRKQDDIDHGIDGPVEFIGQARNIFEGFSAPGIAKTGGGQNQVKISGVVEAAQIVFHEAFPGPFRQPTNGA